MSEQKRHNLSSDLSLADLRIAIANAFNDPENFGVIDPTTNKNTGEILVKVGPVEIHWFGNEGFIDVAPIKGDTSATAESLKKDFLRITNVLPDGQYELNPGPAKNAAGVEVKNMAAKHRMYKAMFKNDDRIVVNTDPKMRDAKGRSTEGFILTVDKDKARHKIFEQYPVESNSKTLSTGEELKWTTGTQAKARNNALLNQLGITEYWDEQGHRWRHEGKGGGQRAWRNRKIVNWREMGVNPTTDEIGTGFISKIGRVLKRRRGMETTTESDAENFREMKRWITEYNNKMKAEHPGDNSRLLYLEHRIKDADWRDYKFPGSSHDAHNLWVTTHAEKIAKDSTEGMLNRENLKDKFLVDYDPETRCIHIIPRDKFGVGVDPTSVSVADFKLSDNLDADSKGLRSLVDQIEQPYIRARNRNIGADQNQNTYQFSAGERTRVNADGTISRVRGVDLPGGGFLRDIFFEPEVLRQVSGYIARGVEFEPGKMKDEYLQNFTPQNLAIGGGITAAAAVGGPLVGIPLAAYGIGVATDAIVEGATGKSLSTRYQEALNYEEDEEGNMVKSAEAQASKQQVFDLLRNR